MACRSLSSKMFRNTDGLHPLFNFLRTLQFKGQPLMINKRIESSQQMEDALSLAVEYLASITDEVCLQKLVFTRFCASLLCSSVIHPSWEGALFERQA